MKNQSPVEYFAQHTAKCEDCRTNAFGLCPTGFRILGEISKMHEFDGQLELLPGDTTERPLVRMFLTNRDGRHPVKST